MVRRGWEKVGGDCGRSGEIWSGWAIMREVGSGWEKLEEAGRGLVRLGDLVEAG